MYCNFCSKSFSTEHGKTAHCNAKHQDERMCPECSKSCKSYQGLMQHIHAKHEIDDSIEIIEYSYECCGSEWFEDEIVEHIRKKHSFTGIRRPHAVGVPDSHNHIWYCFDCETDLKYHRSFDTHWAMLQHLRDLHSHKIYKSDTNKNQFIVDI